MVETHKKKFECRKCSDVRDLVPCIAEVTDSENINIRPPDSCLYEGSRIPNWQPIEDEIPEVVKGVPSDVPTHRKDRVFVVDEDGVTEIVSCFIPV